MGDIQRIQIIKNLFRDARGRVIKMWNYIAGLGQKTTIYEYNSQNQITDIKYQSGYADGRKYKYAYDHAGRLLNTSINYIPQDAPEDYLVFNSYTYNENSQINTFKFDPINLTHIYILMTQEAG
jgi:YD repeat-containing protein